MERTCRKASDVLTGGVIADRARVQRSEFPRAQPRALHPCITVADRRHAHPLRKLLSLHHGSAKSAFACCARLPVYLGYDDRLHRRATAIRCSRRSPAPAAPSRSSDALATLIPWCPSAKSASGLSRHGFVDGPATLLLAEALRRRRSLAVFVTGRSSLSAAHRAGLVHRDFKPDNVSVGSDLGLASISASPERRSERTKPITSAIDFEATTAHHAGSPSAFMSPEQCSEHATRGARHVALYEAVYRRDFEGRDLAELSKIISQAQPTVHDIPAPSLRFTGQLESRRSLPRYRSSNRTLRKSDLDRARGLDGSSMMVSQTHRRHLGARQNAAPPSGTGRLSDLRRAAVALAGSLGNSLVTLRGGLHGRLILGP